jgi:hypothetical protein
MPVAELGRPLSDTELKSRALMLRRAAGVSGGKFITGPAAIAALYDNVYVFGPALHITLADSFFAFEDDAVIRRVSPLVAGAALCRADSSPDVSPPCLSFRAAALANMSFRPLFPDGGGQNNFSFEWEIGKLHWLPRVR